VLHVREVDRVAVDRRLVRGDVQREAVERDRVALGGGAGALPGARDPDAQLGGAAGPDDQLVGLGERGRVAQRARVEDDQQRQAAEVVVGADRDRDLRRAGERRGARGDDGELRLGQRGQALGGRRRPGLRGRAMGRVAELGELAGGDGGDLGVARADPGAAQAVSPGPAPGARR
jgi:hypothetical protein